MLYLCTRKRQGIACRRSSAVEHVICNLGVGGPNPSAGSKKRTKKFALFFCLLTLTLNSVLSTDVSMMYFFYQNQITLFITSLTRLYNLNLELRLLIANFPFSVFSFQLKKRLQNPFEFRSPYKVLDFNVSLTFLVQGS